MKTITYVGPSMHPTLKPLDKLKIVPYSGRRIRRGDVVVFVLPGGHTNIIHRVVSVDSKHIRTRGDNSTYVDPWVLSTDHIIGRVVYAESGQGRRRIFGGTVGRLFAVTVRAIHVVDSWVSFLLRPAYNELVELGIFTRLLPAEMRPRVISFNQSTGTELQLVMGHRVVGRLLQGQTGWHIRRPFRLFVDEESLPENPGKASVVSGQVENKAEVSGTSKDM